MEDFQQLQLLVRKSCHLASAHSKLWPDGLKNKIRPISNQTILTKRALGHSGLKQIIFNFKLMN